MKHVIKTTLSALIAVSLFPGCSSDKKAQTPSGTAPSQVTVTPSAITAGIGDSVVLIATAIGDPAPVFEWSKNGNPLNAASGAHLVINPVQFSDSGIYTVTASNRYGAASGNAARLRVNPAGMTLLGADSAFLMGANSGDTNQRPPHSVTLYSFYMDSTEITQKLYTSLMGVNPSFFRGDYLPVEYLTWFDAVLFCNARSKREGLDTVYTYTGITGTPGNNCSGLAGLSFNLSRRGYRLPTEAEWEYGARAGQNEFYYFQASQAWYSVNSNTSTHEVATRNPNGFNLYDMGGNVYEWCHDWYGAYTASDAINPAGPSSGTQKVIRGGSWQSTQLSIELKPTYRQYSYPHNRRTDIGFRTLLPRVTPGAVN